VRKIHFRFRPTFSLWAMLVLVTVFAIPLSYVAQRRSWNLKRKAAYEVFVAKKYQVKTSWVVSNKGLKSVAADPFGTAPVDWSWAGFWNDLCLESASPRITTFYAIPSHHGPRRIDDEADLGLLACFPEIEKVCLGGSECVTDEGLLALEKLPNLEDLYLTTLPNVSGEFARRLKTLPNLKGLSLKFMRHLNGEAIRRLLGSSSRLTELQIRSCDLVTDESLRGANLASTVTRLEIDSGTIGDETIARWLSQAQLEVLWIHAPVTREIAEPLSRHVGLEELKIHVAPLTDQDFRFLERCGSLKILSLEVMPIRGEFLKGLPAPAALNELKLNCTLLSDENLNALGRCEALESLELEYTPIEGEGFEGVEAWPAMYDMSLMGTRFSERGKKALAAIGGPSYVVLPANWAEDDLHNFAAVKRPWGKNVPENESQIVGGYYPWNSPLWNRMPKHCSETELAPVLKLHALMREQLKQETGLTWER
jgi:hypothetical protein